MTVEWCVGSLAGWLAGSLDIIEKYEDKPQSAASDKNVY